MKAEMSSLPYPQLCRQFSLDEIILATQNFDDELVVGEGGFGKVYKANIDVENNATLIVAIKRLDSGSNQGAPEFWAEIKMLTKLRHCNLVSLIGYCNDNSDMILIYEFMPNGTLDGHLHRYGTSLSWVQRLKISIGAARGLHYLHTGTGNQHGVIHRDVKSSNILLDEDYTAKISDFGLSKIGPTNTSGAYVNTLVRGTFGYLDPEYFLTGRLTRKSDVFAFGVVLFELLCGRVALDNSLDEDECSLVKWAHESIEKGKLYEIIDINIKSQIFPKCLKAFVQIAYRCLSSESKKRPTMAEILVALELCLTLQNKYDSRVKPAAGILSIARMIKWPFISHEVNSAQSDRKPSTVNEDTIQHSSSKENGGEESDKLNLPAFKEYKLDQLRAATRGFSVENIVSNGEIGPNVVYIGKLEDDGRLIAVKRYNKSPWPDTTQFFDEAKAVGQLRSKRLANLLGCCYEGNERLLVAEFMPHGTLAQHLFHWESGTLSWAMRLRVALYLAQALDYCSGKGQPFYHDLNSYRVLFDQECNPRLSSFGLMKNRREGDNFGMDLGLNPPEYFITGIRVTAESVIYCFGTILLELLSGRRIPGFAHSYVVGKNLEMRTDPSLKGFVSYDDAAELERIGSHCLQFEPQGRPNVNSVVAALTPLQKQTNATSFVFMGISKESTDATRILNLLPLGDACSRMDLTAIHEILETIGYSGDERVTRELSFRMWTSQLDNRLNSKKHGDNAFRTKDFTTAIECYTTFIENGTMVSPTMYVRRCLSYLMIDKAQEALGDAMQAQVINPEWSTAVYLQAAALFTLEMDKDANEMLKNAVLLDLETSGVDEI